MSKAAPIPLVLRNTQAPGDILMMTAAVRDLHRCYPGRFATMVDTVASEIWMHNPYVTTVNPKVAAKIRLGYPMIHRSNQWELHFLQGFVEDLNKKQNLNIRLTEFRADLHFSKAELQNPIVSGNYWVILSGGKADFTTKWWDPARHQAVVDALRGKVAFVQMGNRPSGGGARHYHPPLNGVINLVGKTNLRQALLLIKHARGVVCPITFAMHAAAAMGKPCVVVAGGREHYTWEAYTLETLRRNMAWAAGIIKQPPGTQAEWLHWSPSRDGKFQDHTFVPHKYLHSVGQLDCCRTGGCWKAHVTEGKASTNCSNVVRRPGSPPLPRCLDRISADDVVRAILEYEEQLDSRGDTNMSRVSDLVVNIDTASAPPPAQGASPVVDKPRVESKNGAAIAPGELRFNHLKFPITVCVVAFGDHSELAIRCLDSVYKNLHPGLFRLRLGMNEPTDKARDRILAYLQEKNNVDRVYAATPQIYKYPMMRRMFHDAENPITTDWVLWLDDDSHIVDPNFIVSLGSKVDETYLRQDEKAPRGNHCFGKVYYFHFRGKQIAATRKDGKKGWVEEASWYTGRPYLVDTTKRPPMPKSDFCTGGYWLASMEAIRACDWPDPRLKHRGGDIMFGAAVHQQGFGVVQMYDGVRISDAKQRGFNETIAGI